MKHKTFIFLIYIQLLTIWNCTFWVLFYHLKQRFCEARFFTKCYKYRGQCNKDVKFASIRINSSLKNLNKRYYLHKHCVKSVQIRRFSGPYFLVFSPNTGKYGSEKLHILTLFTQWKACTWWFYQWLFYIITMMETQSIN